MITGVNGFIGSNICRELKAKGYEIIGVALDQTCLVKENIVYEQADISDFDRINQLFNKHKPMCVIHLAAIVHKKSMLAAYDDFYRVNYLSSKNIFENCAKNGVKKVFFASTVEVYDMEVSQKITEESTTKPTTDYGKTKLMAEKALIKLAKSSKFDYAIMRFAPVYGQEFTLNLDRRMYLVKHKVIYYFRRGEYFYNMCSIHNIVDFVKETININTTVKGIYNISDTNIFNMKQIIGFEMRKNKVLCIKMPYSLTKFVIKLIEKGLRCINKKSILSNYNFEKIFRCNVFKNAKANQVVGNFKWDIQSTLYK